MGRAFWIRRFATVTALIFAVLVAVELAKGHPPADALSFAATWGLLAGAIFTLARIFQSRRGQRCAICNDTPEPR